MKSKAAIAAVGVVGLVAAGLALYFLWPRFEGKPSVGEVRSPGAAKTPRGVKPPRRGVKLERGAKRSEGIDGIRKSVKTRARKKNLPRGRRPGKPSDGPNRSMFARMSDKDRTLCEAVQSALDANDSQKTIELCSSLVQSSDPAARMHAVDSLGWFGAEALPELTTLMGDPDEDVAQSAINAWESSIFEIDDSADRFKITNMALNALYSRDALQFIGSQFSIAATEYVDAAEGENAVFNRRVEVVQAIVDMIGSQNSALSKVGRDLYDEITGHEWESLDEAERYLADPDNYEPADGSVETLPAPAGFEAPVEPEDGRLPVDQ